MPDEGAGLQPVATPVPLAAGSRRPAGRRRRRTWYLSPEGFRELRHSCFLSRAACADFVGVSLRTVRHWDAGRCRVPWSVVRLLRLYRLGDLGALHAAWAGWVLNRNGLWSPDGKRHDPAMMTAWWLTCEQARFWRDDYGRRAGERLEGASQGAATGVPAGDSLSCPALDMPQRVDTSSPATALFLLPVAAAQVDASVVQAAAHSLPVLPNAGVFLADPAMLAAQFSALTQSQPLPFDSNLLSQCHQIKDFSPLQPGESGAIGPDANRGQKTSSGGI